MSERASNQASLLVGALRNVLSQVASPADVLKTILNLSSRQTGAARGVLVTVSRTGKLRFSVLHRLERERLRGESGRFSRSVFESVIKSGEGIVMGNLRDDERYSAQQSIQALGGVSLLCMPIFVNRRVAALVHLEHDDPGHFTKEHMGLVRAFLDVAGPVLEAELAGRKVLKEKARIAHDAARYREEAEESRQTLSNDWAFGRFVGRSPAVRELETQVEQAAATDFPVLLLGETGTGKSLLARIVHYSGPRAKGPYVTVFCPSLEKSLVEAELFGHKRGAFTGAVSDRVGKVPAAEKGTLFLDEIAELPLEIQPKLLRLLQEKTYERVGDPTERTANVRIVAATNRDLRKEIAEGRFRRDLFERLNFVPLRVPSLRERRSDLCLLLRYCLDQTPSGRWIELDPDVAGYLESVDFDWNGNVRQVEQLAARLALQPGRKRAGVDDLKPLMRTLVEESRLEQSGVSGPAATTLSQGLPELMQREEKARLQQALDRYPHLTRKQLAAKLKISEAALYKKLRQHGISE